MVKSSLALAIFGTLLGVATASVCDDIRSGTMKFLAFGKNVDNKYVFVVTPEAGSESTIHIFTLKSSMDPFSALYASGSSRSVPSGPIELDAGLTYEFREKKTLDPSLFVIIDGKLCTRQSSLENSGAFECYSMYDSKMDQEVPKWHMGYNAVDLTSTQEKAAVRQQIDTKGGCYELKKFNFVKKDNLLPNSKVENYQLEPTKDVFHVSYGFVGVQAASYYSTEKQQIIILDNKAKRIRLLKKFVPNCKLQYPTSDSLNETGYPDYFNSFQWYSAFKCVGNADAGGGGGGSGERKGKSGNAMYYIGGGVVVLLAVALVAFFMIKSRGKQSTLKASGRGVRSSSSAQQSRRGRKQGLTGSSTGAGASTTQGTGANSTVGQSIGGTLKSSAAINKKAASAVDKMLNKSGSKANK